MSNRENRTDLKRRFVAIPRSSMISQGFSRALGS